MKRDGRIVDFDPERISNAIRKAMLATQRYDKELLNKVVDYVLKVIYEKFDERHIPHVEQIQDIVELALVKFDLYEVAKAYILYRKERERIREVKKKILQKESVDDVDKKFSVNAIQLLATRYLLKDEEGKLIEGPKQMFQRVAMAVVIPDILYDKRIFDKAGKQRVWRKEDFDNVKWEGKVGLGKLSNGYEVTWNRWHLERMKALYDELNSQGKMRVSWSKFWRMLIKGEFESYYQNFLEYYNLMVNKKFMPNSPTLFNAGARLGQLSACFVIDIDDNMESIMNCAKEASLIFKSGGGIGVNYSKLRPEGDVVASTGGVASGPLSFMRIIDVVTDVVKQGGCISTDSLLFTDKGIIRPDEIGVQNPRDDNPLPISVYDGKDFTDAFIGSFGNSQELLKFVTEEGYELAVTYDELIATVNENGEITFKPAWEIRENDYLVLTLGEHLGRKVKLDKITNLHFNANKVNVPKYLNEDLAEILGYYMADGAWNNGRLILSLNNEKLLEYFKKKVKKVFNLDVGEIRRKKSWVDVVWFSRALEKYFEKRKWKKENSPNSFIPNDVLKSEERVLSAFLRGLFEGDGSVHSDGYPVLYSTSERLIKETQIALLSLGIFSKIRKVSKEKLGKAHKDKNDVYTLTIIDKESVRKFLQKIGFISENKNEKVKKALQALKTDFPEIVKEFNGSYERCIFVKVKKIEKIKGSVFHFETFSGKYVVNGFLVHNKRRGACMGILEVWHPDIEKFISAKEKEGVLSNFNISVAITPDFWNYYKKNKDYPLVNPRNGRVWKTVNPRYILESAAMMAWKTGDPGMVFLDNLNRRNILKKVKGEIRGTNPCVTGDTYVVTDRGLLEAKELKPGMKVWTLDGWKEIKEVINNGVKDVLKVELENGIEIKVTPDHKFLTKNGWKKASELTKDDEIRLVFDDIEFPNASPLNETLAEFLGYWCGDGSVSVSDHVSVYMGHDNELAKHFTDVIESLAGHAHTFLGDGGQIVVDVHTKKFARMLRETFSFRLGSKSSLKHVPEFILHSSKEVQRAFLRGLFSADGSVYDANGSLNVALYSVSKELLKQVQLMLLTFGIPSTLTIGKKSKDASIKGKEYRTKNTWRLIISGERAKEFFEKIGFLGAKRRKTTKLLSSKRTYKTKHHYTYVKVKKVERCGKEVVYDVVAPDTYTWVTNGLYSKDCGEEPLYPYESCNLGSINLYAHVKFSPEGNASFDWEEFKRTISIATRFLDNVIDINKFPFKKIEKATKASRKIGLGFMGLADVLFALKIPYNSEKGFEFMRRVTEFLTYHAMLTSVELARSRGAFPLFKESGYVDGDMPIEGYYHRSWWTLDWDELAKKIRKHGIRNAEVTTVAPTGSISMLVDVSSGLEPQFALIYEKRVPIGTFYYVDSEFERQLKERGLYNDEILKLVSDNGGSVQGLKKIPKDLREVFVVAYDIPWWDHVRAQAETTKWICAAVSKTINMPNWVTPEDVLNAFLFAHKLGVKGITIYREGSKSVQVLVTPSQRKGRYVSTIKNNTKKLMEKFGIRATNPKKISQPKSANVEEMKKSSSTFPTPEGKEVCPNCGSVRLTYSEGCVRCLDCDWTECLLA